MLEKRTLKRKRMKKLLMSLGISRNQADIFARNSKQLNALALVHPEAVSQESRLFERRLEAYIVLRDIWRKSNKEEVRKRLWSNVRYGVFHDGKNPGIVLLDTIAREFQHKE